MISGCFRVAGNAFDHLKESVDTSNKPAKNEKISGEGLKAIGMAGMAIGAVVGIIALPILFKASVLGGILAGALLVLGIAAFVAGHDTFTVGCNIEKYNREFKEYGLAEARAFWAYVKGGSRSEMEERLDYFTKGTLLKPFYKMVFDANFHK